MNYFEREKKQKNIDGKHSVEGKRYCTYQPEELAQQKKPTQTQSKHTLLPLPRREPDGASWLAGAISAPETQSNRHAKTTKVVKRGDDESVMVGWIARLY